MPAQRIPNPIQQAPATQVPTTTPKGDPYWVMKVDANQPARVVAPAAAVAVATQEAPLLPGTAAPVPGTTAPVSPGGGGFVAVEAVSSNKGASKTLPAVLAVVGGVLATLGAFLDWAAVELTLPAVGRHGTPTVLHATAKGTTGWQGVAIIVLGIALLGIGLAFLLGGGDPAARSGRLIAALVPAAAIVAVSVYTIVSKDSAAAHIAGVSALTDNGLSQTQTSTIYQQLNSSGVVVSSLSKGVYVSLAGGAIGLLAGAWAALAGHRRG